jgi:dihydrodipicolinate synthase/N-acetylneuraminate lyase
MIECRFYGSWATVLLPIREDQQIDFDRLARSTDAIVSYHPAGVYTGGTAGEFHAISEDEFDQVNRLVANRCRAAHVSFQIGAAHTSAQTAVARIRRARELKPDGIQVILPDWLPISDAEAVACMRTFAEVAAGIPLVLYNPPHAKRVLDPSALGRLCREVPQIVAVKVGGGDPSWYAHMREQLPDSVGFFVPGHHMASGVLMGASGSFSNVACLHAGAAQKWFDLIKRSPQEALSIQSQLVGFIARNIEPLAERHALSNPALDKLLAWVGGSKDVGLRVRWPYQSAPKQVADELAQLAARELAAFFALASDGSRPVLQRPHVPSSDFTRRT